MFNSGLKETTQERIVMHEVEYSSLWDIIKFFYSTEIEVSTLVIVLCNDILIKHFHFEIQYMHKLDFFIFELFIV